MELLLSHHGPEQHERCVRIGGRLVCRRCLALWPLCYALIAAQIVLRLPAPHALDLLLPPLLLAPTVEFLEVQAGFRRYNPSRVLLLGPLLAFGLARLFYRYLLHPGDPVTWILLGLVALPCTWAALRPPPAPAPRAARAPGDR